jgi:hypothetical protein
MSFERASLSRVKSAWEYRGEPENMRTIGRYLWRTLLVVVFLAALCALWLGYEELVTVTQVETGTSTPAAGPAPLDPNKLQAQLNAYIARQQRYQAIATSSLPQIPDPSK